MKKINFFLLAALLLCQSGFSSLMAQESVVTPVQGQYYSIVQATGLFLTRNLNAENPKIQNPSGGWDQVFVFENVPDEDNTYYIKNAYDDDYLARGDANAWTMVWVKDPTTITTPANAKYQIVTIADITDYIQIKNMGSGSVLGTDNATDGSSVYGNKNGTTDNNYLWKIKVYTDEVDKTALNNLLAEATALYDATTAGTGSDQYPAAARTAFKLAIDDAQEISDDDRAIQADVNDAILSLTEALAAYKEAVYPYRPNASVTYYINHSSGLYFTNSATIAEGSYAADQYFKFIPVAGKTAIYNIQSVLTGKYLTRDVGETWWWAIIWEDAATDQSQFEIKSTGTGYYTIRSIGEVLDNGVQRNSYMGTDANAAGSGVYLDKSGTDGKHYWKFTDITNQPVVKTVLEEAVAKANEFLSTAVRGDGSDQYPADTYNALTAAIAAAEAVIANSNATQTQVSEATIALNDALAACIASVNPFLADVSKAYNIIHYGGLYFGEYSSETSSNIVAILAKSDANDELIKFVAVPGKTAVYNITVASLPGKYLTRSSEPHLDGNGQPEEGKYDDYKLIWGEDATTDFAQFEIKKVGVQNYHTIKCITPGPQRANSYIGTDNTTEKSGASVDKDGKNTNHYWNIVDVNGTGINPVNVVNKSFVYVENKQVTVKNLEGVNRVNIYSLAGQLISSSTVTGNTFTKGLSSGNYLVVVSGDAPYRGIVVVK